MSVKLLRKSRYILHSKHQHSETDPTIREFQHAGFIVTSQKDSGYASLNFHAGFVAEECAPYVYTGFNSAPCTKMLRLNAIS
ncbi:hypothetical protein VTL71DRAFT_10251, partial [Oculimacula yallundae]